MARWLAAVLVAFAAAAFAQDATLDRARGLIQSKQGKQAFELLSPSGQYTRAAFALERVLAVRPDHERDRAVARGEI